MDIKSTLLKKIFFKTFSNFKFLIRNEFFCFLIIMYMFIVVIGTIEQKNFGLEYAQDIYFNSNFIFLFDFIPFFGGKLILTFVFIILLFRLLIDKWKKKRIGTILLHLGVLFLLFGAFLSNKYCIEGKIIIKENEYSNFFLRDDSYKLKILNKKNNNEVIESIYINKNILKKINLNNIEIFISEFNNNCKINYRNKFLTKDEINGIERFFLISKFPSFVEQDENKINFVLKIKEDGNFKNILILEDNYKVINYDDNNIHLSIDREKEYLPFNLFLSNFEKVVYQGTNKAKNYVSNLIIESNNGLIWKNKIEMNKPLRINDYTFYQTSYLDDSFKKITILTVVKNYWNFYPYLSIFIIFLGFFIHLCISLNKILKVKE